MSSLQAHWLSHFGAVPSDGWHGELREGSRFPWQVNSFCRLIYSLRILGYLVWTVHPVSIAGAFAQHPNSRWTKASSINVRSQQEFSHSAFRRHLTGSAASVRDGQERSSGQPVAPTTGAPRRKAASWISSRRHDAARCLLSRYTCLSTRNSGWAAMGRVRPTKLLNSLPETCRSIWAAIQLTFV